MEQARGGVNSQNSLVPLAWEAFKTTAPRRASGTITGLNRETLVAIIVGKEELV